MPLPTYTPLQPGIPKSLGKDVFYRETPAIQPSVYCFWQLKTRQPLARDCQYLVLPDGCVDIVFDLLNLEAFVTTPDITATQFNLGRDFSYLGIRLRPGMWRESLDGIVGGSLPLKHGRRICHSLANTSPSQQHLLLEQEIRQLQASGIIRSESNVNFLFNGTVADILQKGGFSRRHTQRLVRAATGYRPHDFIKIVRFQQALRTKNFTAYADQSHFIRECKRITGLTPSAFAQAYL